LIKVHIHVKRRFGLNAAWLKTWDEFQENTKTESCLAKPVWKYPKKNYALYKSATAHSIKKSFPWYFYALPIMVAVVMLSVWYSVHRFRQTMGVPAQDASAAGAGTHSDVRSGDNNSAEEVLRHKDFAAWLRPRVAGQPVTAPAYDQLTVQGVPQVYCIAVDDGRCHCLTEQGTRYVVDVKICRAIALDGVYNPFLPPVRHDEVQSRRDGSEQRGDRREVSPASGVASVVGQPVAAGDSRPGGIPQVYTPPEFMPGNQ
jgi:zona occludens toxin